MITKKEGLILYLCEGDRFEGQRLHMVAVTSGQPLIPKLFIQWVKRFYGVASEQLKARIHLWPGTDEEQCKNFWAGELSIKKSQFTKSYIKKQSGRNKKFPYGICRVGLYNKKLFKTIVKELDGLTAV